MTEKRQIPCYCDNLVEIEVPDEVDLAADGALESAIAEGRFLSVTCPKCGKLLKPEFPVRVVDRSRGWEVYLVPELERASVLLGRAAYRLRDTARGRLVVGYPELIEKLAVLHEGLDDRAIEVIKFYLSEKAGEAPNLKIYFKQRDGDRLVFHLHGLKAGEVGVSRIPAALYEKTLAELPRRAEEEPFDLMLKGPYVSYQMVDLEESE